jgi:hypothetical protein
MKRTLLVILAVAGATVSVASAARRPLLVAVQDERPPASATLTVELRRALERKGKTVVDALPMWNQLKYGESALNQGQIDTPITSLWPAALRSTWEAARAYCIGAADPPPFGLANQRAYLCGLQITPFLWQKWLDYVNPERVIIVRVFRTNPNDPNDQRWNIEASSYEPGSLDDFRVFRGEVAPAAVNAIAIELAERARRGEGRVVRRTLERWLPDSPHYHERPLPALPNNGIPVKRK